MDLDRLPVRNLGRDDRIISYWGKEVRYPFLAGHVIDFVARTPVWMKMDFRFGEGIGDKMLLRLLARRLGLEAASSEKKRAIHFGESVLVQQALCLRADLANFVTQVHRLQRWSLAAAGTRVR